MGEETPGIRRGALWEGNTIYQLLYNAGTLNTKFIPVLLENGKPEHIPTPLQGTKYYFLSTEAVYEQLYVKLTIQHRSPKNEFGRRIFPPRPGRRNFPTPETETIYILITALKNEVESLKDELDALKKRNNQSGNSWQEFKDSENYSYPETETIDILIITALKDELDALKNCDNQSGNSWQELKDSENYSYYKTTFNHKNGTQLNIVAARPVEMGENYTNNLATRLISELKPRCLAMTGVCAGNKKDAFLGDVIVANRVLKFDYGKLVAYYDSIDDRQIRTEEIFHDIRTYNLKRQWEFTIQDFPKDWLNTIQTPRPKSYSHQESWLLNRLYDYQQQPYKYIPPQHNSERPTECPSWRTVIQRLKEQELLKINSLELTEKALEKVYNERLEYLEEQHYKDRLNPEIHIGVIATTSKV